MGSSGSGIHRSLSEEGVSVRKDTEVQKCCDWNIHHSFTPHIFIGSLLGYDDTMVIK
jgi:hypothetical protein